MKLQPLTKFKKEGLWLAVVTLRNKLFVAAAEQTIDKTLEKARQNGFSKASLMKSAKNYHAWAPSL